MPASATERREEPQRGEETRQAILDAAERLFAERGIAGASLRSITRDAGANLAAIHYHFGSKEHLVQAVLERRLAPLNRRRLELLEAATARPADGMRVEEVVRAFVAPALELVRQERGGHAFARFLLTTFSDPKGATRETILAELDEIIRRFTDALARCLPELPRREVYWRFHFMVGTMAHTVALGHLVERFSDGLCDPLDVEGVSRRLVDFIAAGMRRPEPEERTGR